MWKAVKDEFRRTVIERAYAAGWKTASLDGAACKKGFPDLVLSRRGTVIFITLCCNDMPLDDNRIRWMQELLGAGMLCEIWTTQDWRRINYVLERGRAAA